MRECPQCFSGIFDDSLTICLTCGANLAPHDMLEKEPGLHSQEPTPDLYDEISAQFKRQFEDKHVFISKEVSELAVILSFFDCCFIP